MARGGADALRGPRRCHPAAICDSTHVADTARPEATRQHDRDDRRGPASDVGGPVLPLQPPAALDHQRRAGLDGLRPAFSPRRASGPPRQNCYRYRWRCSLLMNIQELACAHVEKLPVKVLLLNNQHLGMVVQWEDRFFKGNRAHTYLGAGHDEEPYPNFVQIAKGFK